MGLRRFLNVSVLVLVVSIVGFGQCPRNSDYLYERERMIVTFENTLMSSIPLYARSLNLGFFIFDLADPSNRYISNAKTKNGQCMEFVDRRVYHFAPIDYENSESHFAVLERGNIKIFRSVNCVNSENPLTEVIRYVETVVEGSRDKSAVLTRLHNYRRYGHYRTVDGYRVVCNFDKKVPENADKRFHRGKILSEFSKVIRDSVSENAEGQFSWWFPVEESRANGFFVYDLTDPENKQTSLLERVEFRQDHVYHFALIDAPFSFSNIAIIEDGGLKIFRAINCEKKGDSVDDVIAYLKQKFENDRNRDEIIRRVKDYRKYGVYSPADGISEPQCKDFIPN